MAAKKKKKVPRKSRLGPTDEGVFKKKKKVLCVKKAIIVDKSKVTCHKCRKIGYSARECTLPKKINFIYFGVFFL